MRILYMNQGGGGNWGALDYGRYDVLLLAESTREKPGFAVAYDSRTSPNLQVQVRHQSRIISAMQDIDVTYRTVRPIVHFMLTRAGGIHVVFCHLKSGSAHWATEALRTAAERLKNGMHLSDHNARILWIGDFNRALLLPLRQAFPSISGLVIGGGQARWNLDRVYRSGGAIARAHRVSVSGDHGHIGIEVQIPAQGHRI